MRSANYRPDIDGLRALAVVAVLGFHLTPELLSGGFVGVDVFFVISGYLITGIIISDLSKSRFTFRNFFMRRVRRITPVLLTVTAASVLPAYWLLKPEDMADFAKSVLAQPLALQNIHFLVEGEYFRRSETKPLLHTWSLGVEEQFYLLWPFFLSLLSRRAHRFRELWITALIVVSFLFALACQFISPKVAFFTLPARAWQLGTGGLLCLLTTRSWLPVLGQRSQSILRIVAIIALTTCFAWLDGAKPWPDARAWIPVLATVAIIVAGAAQPEQSILAQPVLVALGKRSYSLYLWHWPIIVYARYLGLDPSSPAVGAAVLALSLTLTEASYRWVENPIRLKRALATDLKLITAAGAAVAILVLPAGVAVATQGASFRYRGLERTLLTGPFNSRTDRCGTLFRMVNPRGIACPLHETPTSERRILLWGNSHAAMWSVLFETLARERDASAYLSARNCPPIPSSTFCDQVIEPTFDYIGQNDFTDVVIAFTWYNSVEYPDEVFDKNMERLALKVAQLGATPWLVLDVPASHHFELTNQLSLARQTPPAFARFPRKDYEARQHGPQFELARRIVERVPQTRILDPSAVFCPGDACVAGQESQAYYRDGGHLTDVGALAAREVMLPVFGGTDARSTLLGL